VLSENIKLLETRKAGFEEFYKSLIPSLIEFVSRLEITPAHEVLNHAVQYAPYLAASLNIMIVDEETDRIWLLTRIGYFVGEYFAQKYNGCWYVNDIPNSKYFGCYVVGQFALVNKPEIMIDPFQIAQSYVDTPPNRDFESLLAEVDRELTA
jgi:hypothetical protein